MSAQPYGPPRERPVVMSDEKEADGLPLPPCVDDWPAGFLATILTEDSTNVNFSERIKLIQANQAHLPANAAYFPSLSLKISQADQLLDRVLKAVNVKEQPAVDSSATRKRKRSIDELQSAPRTDEGFDEPLNDQHVGSIMTSIARFGRRSEDPRISGSIFVRGNVPMPSEIPPPMKPDLGFAPPPPAPPLHAIDNLDRSQFLGLGAAPSQRDVFEQYRQRRSSKYHRMIAEAFTNKMSTSSTPSGPSDEKICYICQQSGHFAKHCKFGIS